MLALLGALAAFTLTAPRVGACHDSPLADATFCTSGPLFGDLETVVIWLAWALFALWCLRRAVRAPRPRRGRPRTPRAPGAPVPATDGSTPRIGAHTAVELPLPARDALRLEYAPSRNGRPDAGEVVWAWVPFQEDPTRGKDRPLLIIGRHDAQHVIAMKLTSRSHDRDRDYLNIGAGEWDRQGRESWLDIDQVYRVHRTGIRREAAALPRETFDRVSRILTARYGWSRAD